MEKTISKSVILPNCQWDIYWSGLISYRSECLLAVNTNTTVFNLATTFTLSATPPPLGCAMLSLLHEV